MGAPHCTGICHSSGPQTSKTLIRNASIAQEGNSGRPVRPGAPSKLLRNLETCAEMEHAKGAKEGSREYVGLWLSIFLLGYKKSKYDIIIIYSMFVITI